MKIKEFLLSFLGILILCGLFIHPQSGPMSLAQTIATIVVAISMIRAFNIVSKAGFNLNAMNSGYTLGIFSALISFALGETFYYLYFINIF